jgi:hypothetical protein
MDVRQHNQEWIPAFAGMIEKNIRRRVRTSTAVARRTSMGPRLHGDDGGKCLPRADIRRLIALRTSMDPCLRGDDVENVRHWCRYPPLNRAAYVHGSPPSRG